MNNPYRAYWEKAQAESIKLGQFYTPECLVELCLELLQPQGELYDPCCGLGSFLLKAKSKDESLKISGNDIDTNLQVPFPITFGDYLASDGKESDYIIANPPFNQKKKHCQLADENFCWIQTIIEQTRKKALIILPAGVNSCLNPKLAAERVKIIESGVLELVCQLPSHLFNQTSIAPTFWLINKEKTNKDIYFLNAERFSQKERKNRLMTAENIQQICNKDNWGLGTYEKIKDCDCLLMVNVFDTQAFPQEPQLTNEEIKAEIKKTATELKSMYEEISKQWNNGLKQLLDDLEKNGELTNYEKNI